MTAAAFLAGFALDGSMAALKEFWFSDAYQEAKKLREGASKVNLIIAVEGVSVAE